MLVLNWNTQADKLKLDSDKFARVKARIDGFDADVICLTEAYSDLMPDPERTIASRPGNRGWQAPGGKRKVMLWSRYGWRKVDDFGSSAMEKGRFISATLMDEDEEWTIIGVCIPWRDYPKVAPKAERTLALWQGACQYLDGLRKDVLPAVAKRPRTVIVGDFNLRIPPSGGYPPLKSEVNAKRTETFAGWNIVTAGELNDPALDKPFIDHIALSSDIELQAMRFISRFAKDGARLSDHNGVCIEVAST